jgi:hypothetical protein
MKQHQPSKHTQGDPITLTQKTGYFIACLLRLLPSFKRFRALSLTTMLILGTAAALVGPIITPKTANAQATGVFAASSVVADVKAAAFRTAIMFCISNEPTRTGGLGNMRAARTVDEITSGQWFNSSDTVVVTPLNSPDDENLECKSDGPFTRTALRSFGWSEGSRIEAACAMGIVERQNGDDDCANGSGDFYYIGSDNSTVYGAIDDKRFDGNFRWTDAMYYILYSRSMEIGCRASPQSLYNDASDDLKELADTSGNYWMMKVVNADGVVNDTIYKSSQDEHRDSKIGLTVKPNDLNPKRTETCIWLVTEANKYAEDYKRYVEVNPDDEEDTSTGDATGGDGGTSCAIDGIGWLVCPVMEFLGGVVDGAYAIVSTLLTTPAVTTNTNSQLYEAWSGMRNIANVAFVIAFIVIIYSQITSVGISNYGIKKMLPRLIVAAILVNVSYWICAIAVDISNILGSSLKGFIEGSGRQLFAETNDGNSAGIWSGLVLGAVTVATGFALYVALAALLPMLVGAMAAIVTILLILVIRQALLVLLIVVSPLAFVAFLLPNTQSLFSKWRKLFMTLLLLFPIVAVLFGSGTLAGDVLTATANDEDLGNPGSLGWVLSAMGAAAPIAILFVVPAILKGAMNVLGRFGAIVNDPNKGMFDRMRKGAEGMGERVEQRRMLHATEEGKGRGLMKRRYRKRAERTKERAGLQGESERAQTAYAAERALNDEAFKNRLAGGSALTNATPEALNRAIAGAVSAQTKIEAEEVTAASAVIKNANLDRNIDAMRKLSMGQDAGGLSGSNHAFRAAAMKQVVDSHDIEGVNTLLNAVSDSNMGTKTREAFADSLASSKEKPEYVGQTAISNIRQHGETVIKNGVSTTVQAKNSVQLAVDAVENNTYSTQKVATGDADELKFIADTAAAFPGLDNTQLMANAHQAMTDPRYKGQISKNAGAVQSLANGQPGTQP